MVTNCFETHDIDWILFDSSIYWWDLYLHAIASYLFESRGEGGARAVHIVLLDLRNWLYLPFLFCLIKIAFILYSGPFTRSLPSIRTIIYFAFAHQSIIIINYSFAYFSYCFFTSCLSLSLSLWWQVLCSDYFSEKNPCDLSIPYDTTESEKQKRDL